MRFKKTIIFSTIILVCFLIYLSFSGQKLIYVALGDSLAAGVNPYGEVSYSYTDFVADYLKSEGKLDLFVKDYAVSGYKSFDVLRDITDNKKVLIDDKEYNIRMLLREADLITISIGANDFLKYFSLDNLHLDDVSYYKEQVDNVLVDVDKLFSQMSKYAKCQVIVVGYYNPFPILFSNYETNLDEIFHYVDYEYQELTEKYNFSYISFYNVFKENSSFLPNPFDIHPNISGYKAMADILTSYYLKNS